MFNRIATAFTLAIVCVASAAAHDLAVPVEHAEVIRLPAEASAIVVGNPSIADAMVHDGRTLVVTGRLQGRTNVIALDRVGRIIYERDIVVSNPVEGQVALFRGPNQSTLSCGAVCDEIPRVGGDATRTEVLTDQQGARLATVDAAMAGDAPQ
ncbi:pilus assembly protein N-terminal domain-containing protein [Maricaulis sp.]|uniref:pilus assembly protein N-terminal domain-containing protein n=1 Tax=Maricaulis sp. TaxID=1486257 RepID=UPI002B26DF67|nr:pilus assembly protein N-terminal domain-containing protein [Maricaulis sp.]